MLEVKKGARDVEAVVGRVNGKGMFGNRGRCPSRCVVVLECDASGVNGGGYEAVYQWFRLGHMFQATIERRDVFLI